jgi:DNA-binding beta-propeller fold protein YncE
MIAGILLSLATVAALGLALLGQHGLANRQDTIQSAGLLVIGAVIFFVLTRRQLARDATSPTDEVTKSGTAPAWALGGFAIPLAMAGLSAAWFYQGRFMGWAWLLWLGAVVATAVTMWIGLGKPRASWWSWWEITAVAAITILGAWFRFYRIDAMPPGLWWDEATAGLVAAKMLEQPGEIPVHTGPPINANYLWLFVWAAFIWIFGQTAEAIRMAAALGGVLYAPAIYVLARELFGRGAAMASASIAAVLLWNVNFSRNAFSYAWTVSLDALALGLLVRAIARRRIGAGLAAGLILGIAHHGYDGARYAIVLVTVFYLVISLAIRDRLVRRARLAVTGVFLTGFIVGVAPIIGWASARPESYFHRVQTASIVAEVQRAGSLQPLVDTTRKHLLMFNVAGDNNGRHNIPGDPMLDQVTAALFVLGLAMIVGRLLSVRSLLLVAWIGASLAAGIFTLAFEAPQALRAIESMTPAILLAGVATATVAAAVSRTAHPSPLHAGPQFAAILVAAVIALNYHAYFVRKASNFQAWADYSTAAAIAAREVAPLAQSHAVYLNESWTNHPTVQYLAPGLKQARPFDAVSNVPLRDSKPVIIVLDGDAEAQIDDIDWLYADTAREQFRPPFGGPIVARRITVPLASIERSRGVTVAQAEGGQKRTLPEPWPTLSHRWDPPPTRPTDIELSGAIVAPSYGRYRFELSAPAGFELRLLDRDTVIPGQPSEITLPKGTINYRVTGRVDAAAAIEVKWAPPGSNQLVPIPASALFRSDEATRGLVARYRRGTNWSAAPAFEQIERYVQRTLHALPLPRPYSLELEGNLYVDKSGLHRFVTDAVGTASLSIDNVDIIAPTRGRSQPASTSLIKGFHQIRVRFQDTEGFSRLQVLWQPPGGDLAPFETEDLYPVGIASAEAPPVQPSPRPVPIGTPAPLLSLAGSSVRWLDSSTSDPRGVAVLPDGSTVVVDAKGRRVVRLDANGRQLVTWTSDVLVEPVDVVADRSGTAWVLDADSNWIVGFDANGRELRRVGGPGLAAYRPRGLGIDAAGNLYVANTGGSQVIIVRPTGEVALRIGPDIGAVGIPQPTDIAVGPTGDIFVVSSELNAIVRLTPDGAYRLHWAIGGSETVRGPHLAIAPDGSILMTDPRNGRVVRFGPDGEPRGAIDRDSIGAVFENPVGVDVGPDGTLYVADPAVPAVVAIQVGAATTR